MIMVLTMFLKLFITCNVNATGRKSFGLAGLGFLGTGMTVDVFHKVGIFCKLREDLEDEVEDTRQLRGTILQNLTGNATRTGTFLHGILSAHPLLQLLIHHLSLLIS